MATVELNAIEDSNPDSTDPENPNGSLTYLRNVYAPGITRVSFIKFDISNPPAYAGGVKLRLTQTGIGSWTQNGILFYLGWVTNNWSEDTLDWAADWPDRFNGDWSDYLTFYTPGVVGGTVDIDVTSYIKDAIAAGATEFSVQLGSEYRLGNAGYTTDFGSSESEYPPKLIFTADVSGSAGVTFATPISVVAYPFPAPDMELPPVVTGEYRRFATADLFADTTTALAYGHDHQMTVRGGVSGKQTIYLQFTLDYITEIKTAKLRLYCIDYNTDGTYMTLKLGLCSPYFTDDSTYSQVSSWAYSKHNIIYTAPEMTIGLVEIDVTSFVQVALGMENNTVAFCIDSYASPIDRDIYATFATHEAPTQFKPHLVLQTIIPESNSRIVPASADCYTSSARPTQTHALPYPVINHELSEYPVCCNPVETAWFYFDFSDFNDTIKTATFTFWVLETSNFLTIETYDFLIKGRAIAFNQETFSYANSGATTSVDVSVACPITVSEYTGLTKKVTVDITAIINHSMIYGGLLLSISGDTAEATKVAEVMIGGRISTHYPYITVATDEKVNKSTEHIDDATVSTGRAIVHAVAQHGDWYGDDDPPDGLPVIPMGHVGRDFYYNHYIKFNLRDVPRSVLSKLDMAILHIPLITLEKTTAWTYYSMLEIDWSMYIYDPDGHDWQVSRLHSFDGYNFFNVTANPMELQFDITYILNNNDYYSHFYDTTDVYFLVIPRSNGDVAGSGIASGDFLRLGTEAGGYPPYIELVWDDYGLDYYVNGFEGSDSNDGLSASTAWFSWNHAMENVPDTKTLYVTGDFNNEPDDNWIAPKQNNVTVRILSHGYRTWDECFVEINPKGTKIYPWHANCEYDYENSSEPDRYRITMDHAAYTDVVEKCLTLYFDVSSFTYPIERAVLYFYALEGYDSVASEYSPTYFHMYADCMAGGITPDTMNTIIDGVLTGDLDQNYITNNLEFKPCWIGIDVTDMLNRVIGHEVETDPILTTGTFAIKLGLLCKAIYYNQFCWITTPLISASEYRPYMTVAQTAQDAERTPGR